MRIGIAGTDGGIKNGHAKSICTMLLGGEFSDQVTVVMGNDEEETRAIAELCGKETYIARNIDEFLERCDAVMVLYRNGNLHADVAVSALEANKAVFVDKPLACDMKDAKRIVDAAKQNHALLHSGSSLSYVPALDEIRELVKENGEVQSVYLAFPLLDQPQHGGIHFYSHHILAEYATVFQDEICSLTAKRVNDNIVILADCGRFPILMNCATSYEGLHFGVYFANRKSFMKEITLQDCAKRQIMHFLASAKEGVLPTDYDTQLTPVILSCAMEESLKTGTTVTVEYK